MGFYHSNMVRNVDGDAQIGSLPTNHDYGTGMSKMEFDMLVRLVDHLRLGSVKLEMLEKPQSRVELPVVDDDGDDDAVCGDGNVYDSVRTIERIHQ